MMTQVEASVVGRQIHRRLCAIFVNGRQDAVRIAVVRGLFLQIRTHRGRAHASSAASSVTPRPKRNWKREFASRIALQYLNYFGDGVRWSKAEQTAKLIGIRLMIEKMVFVIRRDLVNEMRKSLSDVCRSEYLLSSVCSEAEVVMKLIGPREGRIRCEVHLVTHNRTN